MLPIVVMDSGLVLGTPWNDDVDGALPIMAYATAGHLSPDHRMNPQCTPAASM
jgi:hypothetical protein